MICELLTWKCNFFNTILSITLHSDGFCKNQIHLWYQYYPLKQCPQLAVSKYVLVLTWCFVVGCNVVPGKVSSTVIRF
jgi:hypothetical protein